MKKTISNLATFLLLWLGFSMLLVSIYWFITEDKLIASIVGILSVISIFVSIWMMKNEGSNKNNITVSDKFGEFYELDAKDSSTVDDSNDDLGETRIFRKDDFVANELEAVDDLTKEVTDPQDRILSLSLPILSNDQIDFEENFNQFLNDMIDKEMFLKSIDYYQVDQVQNYQHKLNTKIYKYQFHPIPLIALVKSVRGQGGYKVMVGINSKSMQHVANVPESHLNEVDNIYPQLKNIKGSISGGAYVTVSENHEINYDTETLAIDLRLYY